jgi:CheY-like chemotaxis protein
MENGGKKVVAVVSDLMFTVKIQDAAKRAGLEAIFVKSKEQALQQARLQPTVMILDLNDAALEPLAVIEELKREEQTRGVPLLGFVSHVQTDVIQSAQEKGCDKVIARSAFSQNLAAILSRYAEEND